MRSTGKVSEISEVQGNRSFAFAAIILRASPKYRIYLLIFSYATKGEQLALVSSKGVTTFLDEFSPEEFRAINSISSSTPLLLNR